MEKALVEGPGSGTEFPSFASSSSRVPAGQSFSSLRERSLVVGPSGRVEGRGVRRRRGWVRWGKGTGAKWGAQAILPASSRSLQPSADTQQQRAGGGVRDREEKEERKSWCCRYP